MKTLFAQMDENPITAIDDTGPWTRFDKTYPYADPRKYEHIFIQAEEEKAISVFIYVFGFGPQCVTCSHCGENFDIDEFSSLEKASAYHRKGKPLLDFINQDDILIIEKKEIEKIPIEELD